jgi:hypothetical protein
MELSWRLSWLDIRGGWDIEAIWSRDVACVGIQLGRGPSVSAFFGTGSEGRHNRFTSQHEDDLPDPNFD